MRRPEYETKPWGELFDEYKILGDEDRVRQNSRDDFGLGHKWYYCTGGYFDENNKNVWRMVYVKPRPEVVAEVKSFCCDGNIGSFSLDEFQRGRTSITTSDALMIARWCYVAEMTEVPADVMAFVKKYPFRPEDTTDG